MGKKEKPAIISKTVTLEELAKHLGGRLADGDGRQVISGIAAISDAVEGQITYLSDVKNSVKHLKELETTRASGVIAAEKVQGLPLPSIRFEDPHTGFAAALRFFHPEKRPDKGIHPTAFVHEDATVHPSAVIGPLAVVEAGADVGPGATIEGQVYIGRGAIIGENVHLHPQVVVKDSCKVGPRTIIHSGAIIGGDGFGFYKTPAGHLKIPQVGIVEIGSDVEIGANVTVDRATMGKTLIGDGTKIDNLVHIAHNVKIGKNCVIVAQVGISGSTTLGDEVTLAGQVGTVGHVSIGRGTTVAARGVVTHDVEPNSFVSGFPLKPHGEEKRIMAATRKLPELFKTVRELKELICSKGSS